MTASLRRAIFTLTLVAFTAGPGLASAASLTIDAGTTFQTIEGFGTCLPWWVNDPSTSPFFGAAMRSNYVKDLGFNILRVEMHPSALMGSAATLDSAVTLDDDLATNIAKFNFNRPAVKLYGDFAEYVRDNVLEPGTFKLVGAFWTPPHWMKGPNGSVTGGNATPWLNGADANTCGGRLLQTDANKAQFARYVGAWIRGFEQQYGVTWSGVSLQNELIYETEYNSCNYGKDAAGTADQWWQYADALKAVSDYLKSKSITTKIMGPHHAAVAGSPANPWHLYEQMGFIDAVRKHASGNLMDAIGMFASNDYVDGGLDNHAVMMRGYWEGTANVPATWANWSPAGNISQYGKQNWLQETSGEANSWDKDNALGLAQKVHDGLVHGNASAYIYWLISDGGADITTQTLLGTSQLTNPSASKKYSVMKHFSRYIRPGSQRVKATFDTTGWTSYGGSTAHDTYNSLDASAYVKGSTLTVVLVNMRSAAEPTTITLPAALGLQRLQGWRTSASESFAALSDLAVVSNQVTVTVPALSVVTLTGQGGAVSTSTLTVTRSGTGTGSVASTPSGISCGATCSASFTTGATVTLTATAASGSAFTGWSGACAGATGATCTVSMTAAQSVGAAFTLPSTTYDLTVAKSGTGSCTVTSSPSGISCGSTCAATFASGTTVTLTASAASGSVLAGWSACSGTSTCAVPMTAGRTVTVTCNAAPTTYSLSVTKAGTGSGSVASTPSGISCGSTCGASFTAGATVTLTAAAASGSTFTGWSGACATSAATCTVSMSAARAVTATFDATPVTGGCTATYTQSAWSNGSGAGGLTGSVTVKAGNAAISAWTVTVDTGGATIHQSWSSVQSGASPTYTFKNMSWNGSLGAGATTQFGFNASFTGSTPSPTVTCTSP